MVVSPASRRKLRRPRHDLRVRETLGLQGIFDLLCIEFAFVIDAKPQFAGLEFHLNRSLLYPRQSRECLAHSCWSAHGSGHTRHAKGNLGVSLRGIDTRLGVGVSPRWTRFEQF